ncbi:MAG: fibronectin type III domain-containing protein, partial [Bacteroidia bacterium]
MIKQLFFLSVLDIATTQAQTLVVKPFLQDAEPQSIRITWETSSDTESKAYWGTVANALNDSTIGTAMTGQGSSQIHHVQLTGLQPETRYFYRVKTGSLSSSIEQLVTPPLKNAEKGFKLVAMSDMQQDSGNPTVFSEICNGGIIPYITSHYSNDLPKELAFVMIPGDLVDNGLIYSQWANTFFTPSENVFKNVPVYPVLGNHEVNTPTYFKYFSLPENGTSGFLEHWWYKDYSNLRIIGLNSNTGYTTQTQLDWLQSV